jgi:hypothetical protein
MTMFWKESIVACWWGRTVIVVSGAWMTAGPSIDIPGLSSSPSRIAVST